MPTPESPSRALTAGRRIRPDRWEAYKAGFKSAGGSNLVAPIDFALENVFNSFEISVFPKHPLVEKLKQELIRLGATSVLMSGSGASVFGVFGTRSQAESAQESLKPISRYLAVTRFFQGF